EGLRDLDERMQRFPADVHVFVAAGLIQGRDGGHSLVTKRPQGAGRRTPNLRVRVAKVREQLIKFWIHRPHLPVRSPTTPLTWRGRHCSGDWRQRIPAT